MRQQQQSGVQYDASMRHGPVSGPINGSLTALALTVVIWAANRVSEGALPVWLPLAIAIGGSVIAAAVTLLRHSSIPNLVFRCACWIGGGIWSHACLTYAGSKFLLMIVILICGGAAASTFVVLFDRADGADEDGPQPPALTGRRHNADEIGAWLEVQATKLLSLRAGETITFERQNTWPHDSGATYRAEFSVGSPKGRDHIDRIAIDLQRSLRLPDGCLITTRPSGVQGATLVDVMFFNDMKTLQMYPTEYSPRSGRDDFAIAKFGNRTCANVNLYQDSMVIIGRRGGGKTVLEHSITASMVQCRDVIVWHVDLNGGSISVPWCRPVAQGKIAGHVIDWVAHTPKSALRLAEAAHRIALARKVEYAGLTMDANADVLPISAEVPLILVIVDEGGETFGEGATTEDAKKAAELLRTVQRIGRAVCVNIIFSVQRATADYLPAQMKANTAIKVAMKVGNDAELAWLFDWGQRLQSSDLLYKGCAFIQNGDDSPAMAKTYLILPDQMLDVARAALPWRPKMDKASADAAGRDYAQRWTEPDTVAWMSGLAGNKGAYAAVSQATATATIERPSSGGNFAASVERLKRQMAQMNDQDTDGDDLREKVFSMGADDVNATLAQLAQMETFDPDAQPPAEPADEPVNQPVNQPADEQGQDTEVDLQTGKQWCLEVIRDAGPEGIRPSEILDLAVAAGLTKRLGTIHDWRKALVKDTLVEPVLKPDGTTKFGYWKAV